MKLRLRQMLRNPTSHILALAAMISVMLGVASCVAGDPGEGEPFPAAALIANPSLNKGIAVDGSSRTIVVGPGLGVGSPIYVTGTITTTTGGGAQSVTGTVDIGVTKLPMTGTMNLGNQLGAAYSITGAVNANVSGSITGTVSVNNANSGPLNVKSPQAIGDATAAGGYLAYTVNKSNSTAAMNPSLAWGDAPDGDTVASAGLRLFDGGTGYPRARAAVGTTGILATNTEGTRATYSFVVTGVVPVANATEVFSVTGSAAKTIRVTRVEINGSATTGIDVVATLLKRSAGTAGGTATAATGVPHDSNNSAVTAIAGAYTANPTAEGALVGAVGSKVVFLPATTATPGEVTVWDFTQRNEQGIVLRGAAQNLGINLGGASVTGGLLNISVTITEE